MQTIKERADRAIYKPTDRHPLKLYEAIAFTRGYELGATEQKAIDEEVRLKKCDDMTEAEYEREVAFADWYNKNGKGTPTYSRCSPQRWNNLCHSPITIPPLPYGKYLQPCKIARNLRNTH